MALTLVATPGSPSANSYATVAEASAYFDGRLVTAAWDDADDEQRAKALVSATRRIDREPFIADRSKHDQALEWPRWPVANPFGQAYGTEEIPQFLKEAVYELAYDFLTTPTTDREQPVQAQPLTSLSAGSVSLTFDTSLTYSTRPLPPSVVALLAKLNGLTTGGAVLEA